MGDSFAGVCESKYSRFLTYSHPEAGNKAVDLFSGVEMNKEPNGRALLDRWVRLGEYCESRN